MTKNNNVFIRVTNQEIYRKIEKIQTKLDKDIALRLEKMEKRISVAMWCSSTALTLIVIVIGGILIL